MTTQITPEFIFRSIHEQLAGHDDLWHIVNAPKRETWFNTETITALSQRGGDSLESGFRVYGEESYAGIAKILDEHGLSYTSPIKDGDRLRKPDFSILEAPLSESPCFSIGEAKLISPNSTGLYGEMRSDLDSQIKQIAQTKNQDGLLDQLDRARRVVPTATVFGLVFAVHRPGQCKQAIANFFFTDLARRIQGVFKDSAWVLWDKGIEPVPELQRITPLGGPFNGETSLGIGIVTTSSS